MVQRCTILPQIGNISQAIHSHVAKSIAQWGARCFDPDSPIHTTELRCSSCVDGTASSKSVEDRDSTDER